MSKKHGQIGKLAKLYILDNVTADGYDVEEPITVREKIDFLKNTFYSEYGWYVERVNGNEVRALDEWLRGVPSAVNVAIWNSDILDLAVSWGSLPEDYSEKQAEKILENYWNLLANNIHQLFKGYRIPYEDATL